LIAIPVAAGMKHHWIQTNNILKYTFLQTNNNNTNIIFCEGVFYRFIGFTLPPGVAGTHLNWKERMRMRMRMKWNESEITKKFWFVLIGILLLM
jgi:hypothetical protein